MSRTLLLALILAGFAPVLHAAETAAQAEGINPRDSKRGWFFYKDPKKTEPQEPETPPSTQPKPPAPPVAETKDPCKQKETWNPKCGFVDPGQDFEFQAKQRDALLERMALSQNDPKAVEQFQYYMRWMMRQATAVAAMWEYNKVQNPELDPAVTAPVSTLGLEMLRDASAKDAAGVFKVLREQGAFFVYFSRSDCDYCHAMRSPLQALAKKTGLEIYNASLDDQCMPGYEQHCLKGDAVQLPAAALQVSIVPTVFLHVPSTTWIRVGTGIVDAATLAARASNFFAQTRSALAKGLSVSPEDAAKGKAPMDFTNPTKVGVGTGVAEDPTAPVPTAADIKSLLQPGSGAR